MQPASELNGSVLDHLSPVPVAPPPDKSGPGAKSDEPPPYNTARQVKGQVVMATVPSMPSGGVKGPSGASKGGVLLKHIPYLPSSGSVEHRVLGSEVDGVDPGGSEVTDSDISAVGEDVSELEQKVRVRMEEGDNSSIKMEAQNKDSPLRCLNTTF